MKLAEALADRAAARRRVEQLRVRIVASARYQEGEPPAEDAQALLTEADAVFDEFETLIARINRTNSAERIADGTTISDALARRDVLRARHSLIVAAADGAIGRDQHGYVRQLRSELRMISALPVSELRTRADSLARELRELDVEIQRSNWAVDLAD